MSESGGTIAPPSGVERSSIPTGTKYDQEKPDFSLIDAEWLEEVAKVMTFGKKKYDANNWRKGIALSRVLSAGLRHLWAVVRGEDNDPETGLSHLAHLSCCAMFGYWYLRHRRDLDDRYKEGDIQVELDTRIEDWNRVGLGREVGTTQSSCNITNCFICSPRKV